MNVRIDEAGNHNASARIDKFGVLRVGPGRDFDDPVILDQNIEVACSDLGVHGYDMATFNQLSNHCLSPG